MPLSEMKIRNAKPQNKPYKLFDGGGLFLLVSSLAGKSNDGKPSVSRLWKIKYRYLGKEKEYAAGTYPLIGVSEAREIRDSVKKLLISGVDPNQHRRITRQQKAEASENTFEAVARRWMAVKKAENSHKDRSLRRLELHAFPRTGELIGARWEEIDCDRQEWVIPAERMKMRNPHLVPLSGQALEIFKELYEITGKHDLVFFSPANKEKHISNNAILSALKRMGYAGRMTGHGFRSLASTILNEQRKYHPDIIERQLAHADRNEVRAVYNRADYLLERKKMMQEWADFLDTAAKEESRIVKGKFGNPQKADQNA